MTRYQSSPPAASTATHFAARGISASWSALGQVRNRSAHGIETSRVFSATGPSSLIAACAEASSLPVATITSSGAPALSLTR